MQSYHPDRLLNLKRRFLSLRTISISLFQTVLTYRSLEDPEDLLDVSHCGITIGDIAYNTYLRKESTATVDDISVGVVKHLFFAFVYTQYFDGVLTEDISDVLIGVDFYYSRSGILHRVALNKGMTVHLINNQDSKTQIKRYTPADTPTENFFRPDERIIDDLIDQSQEEAMSLADDWIEQRKQSTVKGATQMSEQITVSEDTPVVAIMPHILNDAVHSGEKTLFRDYYTWVEASLRTASSVSDVHWIVKPHPHRLSDTHNYGYRTNVEDIYRQVLPHDPDHIHLIPPSTDSVQLAEMLSAVVTVRGTVGLEYSALGIPAVTAGTGSYSGFGFTVDSQTKNEYRSQLESICSIEPLSNLEIQRAKAVLATRFQLTTVPSTLISSQFDGSENMSANKMWQLLAEDMDPEPDLDPLYLSLKRYVNSDYRQAIAPRHWSLLADTPSGSPGK